MPQTVLVERYWTEIRTGLEKEGVAVHHFVLHSDPDTLTRRIETDDATNAQFPKARQWRLDHRTAYRDALPWLSREAEVIDTAPLSPQQVARLVAEAVSADTP